MSYYAVIPSPGCYGSEQTVRSVYGTAHRAKAIARAKRLTRDHRRSMVPYGWTSGGYRVVQTDVLRRAGAVVAAYGHEADAMATVTD